MVVRNGVETQNVTSKDFDLTSASASRVLLPCRAWGELRLEMMNAALGMMSEEELHKVCDVPYEKVVQHEDVKMLFNIQRKQVRLTAHASGDVVLGRHFDARIPSHGRRNRNYKRSGRVLFMRESWPKSRICGLLW